MNEQQSKILSEVALLSGWKHQILSEALSLLNDQCYTRERAAQKLLEVVADIGESEQACLSVVIESGHE
ncbi:hypothetical protein A3844_23015 [Paenibacillus helianthi]|uniref:ANTAR domain-containing protein n=1 Tax=Paenibacillus helianthi TaxID=1349432 RepID=A0ABX3ELL2_9BACL|nr:hypothetical protein [Paenibacillus helianthi]OKP82842.1 hypothetical protein A3844_23015 [Paenibacillus helianthi]